MRQKSPHSPGSKSSTPGDGLVRRLFKGGIANLIASAAASLTPLLGVQALMSDEYAIWTLVAVTATAMLVLEWGSTTLATRVAARGGLSAASELRLGLVATSGPLVLGVIAIVLWPAYSAGTGLDAYSIETVQVVLGGVTFGCFLRAYANVVIAALLGMRQFVPRSQVLIGGALIQFVVTLVALRVGAGLSALAFGYVSSGLVQVAMVIWVRRGLQESMSQETAYVLTNSEIRTYLFSKGSVSLLGLTVTQMDRWVLGAVLDPDQLRTYDVAARLAMMPKVALIAICAGLIAEASRPASELRRLYRRALLIVCGLSLLGATLSLAFLWIASLGSDLIATGSMVLALAVVAAHAVNAVTIPSVMMLGGIGRPQLELTYTVPLFVIVNIAYGIGLSTGQEWLTVGIWAGAMVLTSAAFSIYSQKWMVRNEC